MAVTYNTSKIVTDGLILCLDASNPQSYPGSGTTITDLSGRGATGTIFGAVNFVSARGASYWDIPTAGDGNYIGSTLSQTYVDCTIVFMPDLTYNPNSQLVGLIASSAATTLSDDSLRFRTNGSSWSIVSRNPGDQNDWAFGSATTYYVNGSVSNVLVSGWNIFGGYRTNRSSFNAGDSFPYFLGSSGYTGRNFKGRIAVALMYNRQLSASEQLQNYRTLRGRFGV